MQPCLKSAYGGHPDTADLYMPTRTSDLPALKKTHAHERARQVKAGAARMRQRWLGTAAVVGVTCCSASLPAMDGITFDVAVLDEASQVVEPLSVLPLACGGCRRAPQAASAPAWVSVLA